MNRNGLFQKTQGASIKRASLLLVLLTLLGGFIFRIGRPDCGLSGLSRIGELEDYEITLNNVWNEADASAMATDFLDNYDGVDAAGVIAVVSPTGNFIQTEGSIGQEFNVDQVLRGGHQISPDKNYYVYKSSGFYPADRNIEYCCNINLMMPEHKYLIFMNESPLNEYQKKKAFLLASEILGYVRIDAALTETLKENDREYNFADLGEYEFFSASDAVTVILNEKRKELLEKYGVRAAK